MIHLHPTGRRSGGALIVLAMLLLAACSGGGESERYRRWPRRQGRLRRNTDGRLRRGSARQRTATARAAWPRRRLPGFRRAPAGLRRNSQAAVPRGLDRSPRADPLPDRSQHLRRAAGAGLGQPPERARQCGRREDAGPALCTARQDGSDFQAGLHGRGRAGSPGRCRSGPERGHTTAAQVNCDSPGSRRQSPGASACPA